MEIINRNKCIMCEGVLIHLHTFEKFPIYMGVSEKPQTDDLSADMIFTGCVSCGTIQLCELIPLDVLYEVPHNTAIGKIWDKHHKDFSDFMSKYVKNDIVEIGGGNLILAKHLELNDSVESITIYDTNSYGEYESDKISLEEKFFNPKEINKRVDAVIHSHLLEHLYNPIEDLKNINNILNDDGYIIMSVPLIDEMLKDKFTNAMNFEHTYMATYKIVERMLNESGFKIVESKNFSKYNTFIVAEKSDIIKNESECDDGVSIVIDFINYYEESVKDIKTNLPLNKDNTFIFGAHIFTQYLFGFGLNSESFSMVLDNDTNKQDKRLYGTNLMVSSPKILKDIKEPVVVLKAAQYTEEIKNDILENINPNTKFIL